MNEQTQPATVTNDIPTRAPRTIDDTVMRAHEANGQVVALARFDRHRMFVRYDNTWWVAHRDSFIEITSADQTAKLDRWHRRVTQGALWD